MTGPIDGVMAMHNALRADLKIIDAAALDSARGKPGLAAIVERFRFFNEVLSWHAEGEEVAIFPLMEQVAPFVVEMYEKDHRGLDAAFATLSDAVSLHDALQTARATAAFRFHLDLHLEKEDTHLYRIMRERVAEPDQGKAVGVMASQMPANRWPEFVAWLYPLISDVDRETMTRIYRMWMPGRAFASSAKLIRKAVGDGWAELVRRIPEMASESEHPESPKS